jgi:peptidoglycan/LPS O-acetylase OafA/YrhL
LFFAGSRVVYLDLLRFLAVFLVLGSHLNYYVTFENELLNSILTFWRKVGWSGVDLFFVLSGYLIASILFREIERSGTLNVKRFLTRRMLKILPPYFALVGFVLTYDFLITKRFDFNQLIHFLTFTQNYEAELWESVWPLEHSWSICIEEHFYVMLPFLIVSRKRARRIYPIVVALVLLGCFSMRWMSSDEIVKNHRFAYMSHLRLDALLFGTFFAWMEFMSLQKKLENKCMIVISLVVIVMAVVYFWFIPNKVLTYTFVFLFYGVVLLLAKKIEIKGHWSLVPFIFVGQCSYSIYLWHIPVREYMIPMLSLESHAAVFFAYMVGSLVVGISMGYAIEKPFLKIRDRFFMAT